MKIRQGNGNDGQLSSIRRIRPINRLSRRTRPPPSRNQNHRHPGLQWQERPSRGPGPFSPTGVMSAVPLAFIAHRRRIQEQVLKRTVGVTGARATCHGPVPMR